MVGAHDRASAAGPATSTRTAWSRRWSSPRPPPSSTTRRAVPGRRRHDDLDRRPRSAAEPLGRRDDDLRLAPAARRRRRDHAHRDRPHDPRASCRTPTSGSCSAGGADIDVATEEFIRFVTPIHNMCRVANEDVEIGGETIEGGPPAGAHVLVGEPRRGPLPRARARSTSPATRTTTSPSGSAPTSASAPRWPAWRSGCSSRSSCGACARSGSPGRSRRWGTRSSTASKTAHLELEFA